MHVEPFIGVLVTALAISNAEPAPKPAAPARRLPAPTHVTPETRAQIRKRMSVHATTMQNLVRAVILLDRPTIRVLATRISDEEVVARTSGLADRNQPSLPLRFFAEQTDLSTVARLLAAAAADGGDDKMLAEKFSALTRTCVGCHSAYLHDRPELPAPIDPNRKTDTASSRPAR